LATFLAKLEDTALQYTYFMVFISRFSFFWANFYEHSYPFFIFTWFLPGFYSCMCRDTIAALTKNSQLPCRAYQEHILVMRTISTCAIETGGGRTLRYWQIDLSWAMVHFSQVEVGFLDGARRTLERGQCL